MMILCVLNLLMVALNTALLCSHVEPQALFLGLIIFNAFAAGATAL